MAWHVVFAPEASAQIVALYKYVAERAGEDRAFAFTQSILDYCESFTTFPERGTARGDIRPGLRTIGFRKRATIAFDIDGETITILGIFYGGQDFESDMSAEDEA
jgi:toxin ParE1/3/4